MNIRKPAVAGMFYYSDKELLINQLKEFFSDVKIEKTCRCVVSPHAGYIYSGKTASYAISSLEEGKTFVILGPNHYGTGPVFSIMDSGVWETPLGNVKINDDIAKKLINKCDFLEDDITAHIHEHSIEVQLPFIQYKF